MAGACRGLSNQFLLRSFVFIQVTEGLHELTEAWKKWEGVFVAHRLHSGWSSRGHLETQLSGDRAISYLEVRSGSVSRWSVICRR